ncbi:MAG: 30S ribosomal protein S2 [Deltaproteobacteria bacterium CG11_big_fil_rev_8_21_14_0_20_47_16]|nr:MAG: 30S ribosomal protein S2 [Deltaproteobacteria bacterium CG11_big_fil_rev_8_21_14_0_20_47_16]
MSADIKTLLEAGVHFGHQTSRWNPKMKPYIYGARNGIHIIDLDQTVTMLDAACKAVTDAVSHGSDILFVGTKKQAQDIVREQAERIGQYFVNYRWLGGMLTNFKTIKKSIDYLNNMTKKREAGEFEKFTKKEASLINKEIDKLEETRGGIRNMTKIPGVIFLVDPKNEHIALKEARTLGLTVIALADSNCDPDGVDYLIPGNDDAIRAISIITTMIAEAARVGLEKRAAIMREEDASRKARGEKAPKGPIERKIGSKGKAYVGKTESISKEEAEGFASASATAPSTDTTTN